MDDAMDIDEEETTIWDPSPSPEETWSDSEDIEWAHKGVVGEHINLFGENKYEVRWLDWHRRDGTSTTWEREGDNPDLVNDIKEWKKKRNATNLQLARESISIPMDTFTSIDVANENDKRKLHAYDERVARAKTAALASRFSGWEDEADRFVRELETEEDTTMDRERARGLRAKRQRSSSSRTLDRAESARQSSISSSKRPRTPSTSTTNTYSSGSTRTQSTSSSVPVSPFTFTFPLGSSRSTTASSPSSKADTPGPATSKKPSSSSRSTSALEVVSHSRPSRPLLKATKFPKRITMEQQWTRAAKNVRAASVKIVNTIDDEEVPLLVPNFRYLENAYIFGPHVEHPDVDRSFFLKCDCSDCVDADECACQDASELVNEYGQKIYAYNDDGLFTFEVERGMKVIECNKYCRCSPAMCTNRVAQRPRDVPVEIFKTEYCGWGARLGVDVERGCVLGIYTGKLMRVTRREDAESAVNKRYLFNLDGDENVEEVEDGGYTVDSHECGNWTRFINHSCDPNTVVYSVVYDTVPEMRMPYHAFVAKTDIPMHTELTFDYDPAKTEAALKVKGKGKGKPKIPQGAEQCFCGAANCRQWM
ncbi:hypothetical protein PLICRDRAFT_177161 [Plicaturopsis crispa FD-325 SS-3]|nr:hypothetical protein PLICRDRAFT_177161 [Plicaturopsis crispa FD-325 SS-3]